MTSSPIVSVRGASYLEVEPEIAVVSITVSARDPDRERVSRQLAQRLADTNALVLRLGSAVEKYESGAIQIHPELNKGQHERVRRYVGRATSTATVADFTRLSDLLVGASEIELSEVNGPWWQLRRDSPVHREARVLAVTDAITRAREYAAAFGSEIVGLVEVSDVGMSVGSARPMAFAASARDLGGGSTEAATFDLTPALQQVTGAIEARFTMTEPDLSP